MVQNRHLKKGYSSSTTKRDKHFGSTASVDELYWTHNKRVRRCRGIHIYLSLLKEDECVFNKILKIKSIRIVMRTPTIATKEII